MSIFCKKQPVLTQVEVAKDALLKGKVLDQMNMLFDYGIGNHTAVIAEVRKEFAAEGKPYHYVETEKVAIKAKKSGKIVYVARYSIPELRKK